MPLVYALVMPVYVTVTPIYTFVTLGNALAIPIYTLVTLVYTLVTLVDARMQRHNPNWIHTNHIATSCVNIDDCPFVLDYRFFVIGLVTVIAFFPTLEMEQSVDVPW